MRKGIWAIKRSELTPDELEWIRNVCRDRKAKWVSKNRKKLNAYRRERYKTDANHREQVRLNGQKWARNNPKKVAQRYARYRSKNREKVRLAEKSWRHRNSEKVKGFRLRYRLKNRQVYNKARYLRLKNDPQFVTLNRLRARLHAALKKTGYKKSASTVKLCGCTPNELMLHLQSKFQEGMHWNNYGKWHIDHIRPCASFDLTDPEQQKQCFHYTNLQPLWAAENLSKGAKVITPHETYA